MIRSYSQTIYRKPLWLPCNFVCCDSSFEIERAMQKVRQYNLGVMEKLPIYTNIENKQIYSFNIIRPKFLFSEFLENGKYTDGTKGNEFNSTIPQ